MRQARGGFLSSLLSAGVRTIGGFLKGGPVGAVGGLLAGAAVPPLVKKATGLGFPGPGGRTIHPLAALPGGAPLITGPHRRRRMNPANPKALKRAIRREQGFVKLARRTLKGTGFTISRRGVASKRRRR